MPQRRGKSPPMASLHVTCFKCMFSLDACLRINEIGPNIKAWCPVSEPCIVSLLSYNELHDPIGQYERPRVWG